MKLTKTIFISALLYFSHVSALTLGVSSVIEPEILKRELAPIVAALESLGEDVELIFSNNSEHFMQLAEGRIDLTYVGGGYGVIFTQELGFIPSLISNEQLQALIFSGVPTTLVQLQRSHDLTVLLNRNDFLIMKSVKELVSANTQYRYYDNNARVLFQILKNFKHVGAVPLEEFGLLPARLKRKMHIILQSDVSPIYFLVHSRLKKKVKKIQSHMLNFHQQWQKTKDQKSTRTVYLNTYTFRKITAEEAKSLNDSDTLSKIKRIKTEADN